MFGTIKELLEMEIGVDEFIDLLGYWKDQGVINKRYHDRAVKAIRDYADKNDLYVLTGRDILEAEKMMGFSPIDSMRGYAGLARHVGAGAVKSAREKWKSMFESDDMPITDLDELEAGPELLDWLEESDDADKKIDSDVLKFGVDFFTKFVIAAAGSGISETKIYRLVDILREYARDKDADFVFGDEDVSMIVNKIKNHFGEADYEDDDSDDEEMSDDLIEQMRARAGI